MAGPQSRSYCRAEVITFRRTNDAFGALSNMAPGYPILAAGCRIRTAEALYQACRFPHLPEVQQMILDEYSPMTAKMRSKPFRDQSRDDWDDVRVRIMKWCLRAKLASNWVTFSTELLATGHRAIVEDSRKDGFWGAKPDGDAMLQGCNVLGRLLMQLRDALHKDPDPLRTVKPLRVPNFLLLSRPITAITMAARDDCSPDRLVARANPQPAFL